ncbi:hypothetical protein M0R45_035313 [Rubus argutus]|uniref:Uncharacterized protein n=1 Tax=Rubus argutus TaxID=59490 RepID=A0AAW1VWJ7_RUBAR
MEDWLHIKHFSSLAICQALASENVSGTLSLFKTLLCTHCTGPLLPARAPNSPPLQPPSSRTTPSTQQTSSQHTPHRHHLCSPPHHKCCTSSLRSPTADHPPPHRITITASPAPPIAAALSRCRIQIKPIQLGTSFNSWFSSNQ